MKDLAVALEMTNMSFAHCGKGIDSSSLRYSE